MALTHHKLQQAVQHHQAGRLDEAEKLYRDVLRVDSRHADARHLLGVAALQRKHYESAREHIQQAIADNDSAPSYHSNLGAVYQALGAFSDAGNCFLRAVELDPHFSSAHFNLGRVYESLGQLDQALESFTTASQCDAGHPEAERKAGLIHFRQNRFDAAIEQFEKITSKPYATATDYYHLAESQRRSGNEVAARASYDAAIEIDPKFAEAHNNLATLLKNNQLTDHALAHLTTAVRLEPDKAAYGCNLASVLRDAGRMEDAIAAYEQVLKYNPNHEQSLLGMGDVLQGSGSHDRALACYDGIIAKTDTNPEAHLRRGDALQKLGRLGDAIASYESALRMQPQYAKAWFAFGNLRADQGDLRLAVDCYQQALQIDAAYVEAHNNLGVTYKDQDRIAEARLCYDRALQLNPQFVEAHYNLANLLHEQGECESAISHFKQALNLDPHHLRAMTNLGVALKDDGRLDEAIDCYERVLATEPQNIEACTNLGVALEQQGHIGRAVDCYGRVIEHATRTATRDESGNDIRSNAPAGNAAGSHPDGIAETRFNRSLAWLLAGNFKQGWPEYESRWLSEFEPRSFVEPAWDGSTLAGQKLLVYGEQGVGDEIMFSACIPKVLQQTAACVIECDTRLVPLFKRSFPDSQVVARPIPRDSHSRKVIPNVDLQVAMGSLPGLVLPNADDEDVPFRFLQPDQQRIAHFKNQLQRKPQLRIGISWRGGKNRNAKRKRSITLEQWMPIFNVPGASFVNLQYGDCQSELSKMHENDFATIQSLPDCDPLANLDDFAALIAALDLVISIDNTTVHMAGALGTPVWTLLPFVPDWRWQLERSDSPWYPGMRLFRQPSAGDWPAVIEQVAAELSTLIHDSRRTSTGPAFGSQHGGCS